jgi:aspartate/methionine/tyrosine aminotransferase
MRERTIVVGSVSKEYRMIGWRVGWVVGPAGIMDDIARVGVYNVVTPVGIAQAGAVAALTATDEAADVVDVVSRWEARRDAVLAALAEYPVRNAGGGWSLLVDAAQLGMPARELSRRLLESGGVAATPMDAWGSLRAGDQLRLVFSREPVDRLSTLGERFRRALV